MNTSSTAPPPPATPPSGPARPRRPSRRLDADPSSLQRPPPDRRGRTANGDRRRDHRGRSPLASSAASSAVDPRQLVRGLQFSGRPPPVFRRDVARLRRGDRVLARYVGVRRLGVLRRLTPVVASLSTVAWRRHDIRRLSTSAVCSAAIVSRWPPAAQVDVDLRHPSSTSASFSAAGEPPSPRCRLDRALRPGGRNCGSGAAPAGAGGDARYRRCANAGDGDRCGRGGGDGGRRRGRCDGRYASPR